MANLPGKYNAEGTFSPVLSRNLAALNERGKWVGKIASSGSFNITRALLNTNHTHTHVFSTTLLIIAQISLPQKFRVH
jgi:hypothetical protein